MAVTTKFRKLIDDEQLAVVPGGYDCITARLIEQAGFEAVYMSGGCTAAMLGFPDYGLTTMTEMVENAGRMATAVQIPVIADADTGYGSEINVYRTVQEYERAGLAGIQIEDQIFPKKCGHLSGKEIVPEDEFIRKIRAAAAARTDKDFALIARTDARSVVGFEEAVRRMNAALANGADVAFVEAPETDEELRDIPRSISGPCLLNMVTGGKTPVVDLSKVAEYGFQIAIVPGLLLQHIVGCCDDILNRLKTESAFPIPQGDITIPSLFQRMGSDYWDEIEGKINM